MKNKIQGVGLDTSPLMYKPSLDYLPKILYINTSSNNSFYLPPKIEEERNIIVEVGSGEYVREILKGLGMKKIDVLLLPADSLQVRKEELVNVLDEYGIESVGISRPESLTQLREAADKIKQVIIPSYVALNLCPIHFQKDIIDWANNNQLRIIGLNPFGGYNLSPLVIQSFSIPFLLSFSAAYSEVVILSGRDLVSAQYETLYLNDLIGKEWLSGVEMKSTVIYNPLPPLPKFIYTGLKDGIEYENPWYITFQNELTLRMKPIEEKEENGEISKEVGKVLDEVAMFDTLTLPHPKDPSLYMSILRPTLLKELGEALGPKYMIEQEKIGTTTFLVNVRKRWREKRYLGKDRVWYEDLVFGMWLDSEGNLKFRYYN